MATEDGCGISRKRILLETSPEAGRAVDQAVAAEDLAASFESLPIEIREIILRLLPGEDLLRCRLVNRTWKAEASTVLRKFKKCCVVLRESSSSALVRLDLAMKRSTFDMINGLKFEEPCTTKCNEGFPGSSLSPYRLSRLKGIPFKYLFFYHIEFCHICKVFAEKMVKQCAGSLEVLSLPYETGQRFMTDVCSQAARQELTFPRLRRLELPASFRMTLSMRQFLTKYVPNLKEITLHGNANAWDWDSGYEDFPMQISEVSVYGGDPDDARRQLERISADNAETLKILEITNKCDPSWSGSIVRLLHARRDRLAKMRVCIFSLIQALEAPCQELDFPNLKRLSLRMPDLMSDSFHAGILQKLNFGQRFPALKEIDLWGGCRCYNAHQNEMDNIAPDRSMPSPSNANCMEINNIHSSSTSLKDLGQTFPFITTLKVDWNGYILGISTTFVTFPNLVFLTVMMDKDGGGKAAIDALLCGISVEEASLLQDESKNGSISLEDLDIVPIRPPLTSLKHLKTLTLSLDNVLADACLISEVSRILVFSKWPSLQVRVETEERSGATEGRNYGSVTLCKC